MRAPMRELRSARQPPVQDALPEEAQEQRLAEACSASVPRRQARSPLAELQGQG